MKEFHLNLILSVVVDLVKEEVDENPEKREVPEEVAGVAATVLVSIEAEELVRAGGLVAVVERKE